MAIAAGSIAFVGFNADGRDNIAFVALTDISAGEVIIFEDNEWNGTAFVDANESAFSWTATALVPAGTVVQIDGIGTGPISASTGTAVAPVSGRGANLGIAASNEVIYAYQGTPGTPATFLAAIANSGFTPANGALTDTGLTAGINAIEFTTSIDLAAYNGARSTEASLSAYLPLINNPSNWITQDGTGDQSIDGTAPDVPFSADAFTAGSVPPPPTPAVNLSVSRNSGSEADTTQITVTATASSAVIGNQTVSLAVSGTGITPGDFFLSSNTITIPNGQTAGSVTFTVADDAIVEALETATLTLSAPSAGISLGSTIAQPIAIANNNASFLTKIGGYASATGAEIPAFDSGSDRLFVVAGTVVEILNVANAATPTKIGDLAFDTSAVPPGFTLLPNSVAVGKAGTPSEGIVAVAIAITDPATAVENPGEVQFFRAATGEFLGKATVGFLPDMIAFSPDGTKVLSANEAQPNNAYTIDPEGSVSIIDLSGGFASPTVREASFGSFNGQIDALRAAGVRIFGPGATVAQDLEPEYITFSGDGTKALVTLQENNALAVVDIGTATVESILPLGVKDHSLPGNGLDASDRDSSINIRNWPVFGLYQPDAIASFAIDGQTYYITANEGDSRGYAGFSEEIRVGATGYVLDPTVFPNAATLKDNANLGRLQLTNATGDTDGDGDFDRIEAFGARSFSIWDQSGQLVYDSGDRLEQITAAKAPTLFNSDGSAVSFDSRSDNKGPEPEGVVVGVINNRTYAFIGLERVGDVIVYEVTDPRNPAFVQYINTPEDSSVEGLTFIAAADSPTGKPLLVTASEVSNTVAIFEIDPPVRISDIQGKGHLSPLVGQAVAGVTGIVTAIDTNGGRGFYLQDPNPDTDPGTSEAIFVFTNAAPTVAIGDKVAVSGTVSEFTPGGASTGNLSITQIVSPTVTVLSSGNPLPSAEIIGAGGRIPPNQVIDDDPLNAFDPANDGIDFLESLEGMRVTLKDTVAVSATNSFGEIYTVTDNGTGATGLSDRGTLNISPDDFNPERLQIDEDTGVLDFAFPSVNVGDKLGDVTGVVSYNFGNFEVIPTQDFTGNIQSAGLQPEVATLAKDENKLAFASYNALNLDPNDGDGDLDVANGRFKAIAQQIVSNLGSPDIIGLQEIQDSSGSTDDGTIGADATLQLLVDEIAAAGGPTYKFIDNTFITNNTSGGQPGGNIRTAFLYDDSRVDLVPGSVQTIADPAFDGSRLPLVATFTFNGEEVTLVNNHFSSKGGSSPLFGVNQPSVGDEANGNGQENPAINGSLDQRQAQAQAVKTYVDGLLAGDADAKVAVLGDLNEFEFISPLSILKGGSAPVLTNLVETLPENERYSFIFDGNSQSLDHILVSNNLATAAALDIVHVNTEFAETSQTASDHDPLLASLTIEPAEPDPFVLELLHFADQEAGIPALDDAPRFSAVLAALKNQDLGDDGLPDNTLVLSSGDAYIPGAFLNASQQAFGGQGRADILIQNELEVQAIAFGNHEFDFGTSLVANLLKPAPASGTFPAYPGAAFPYLSGNLDFTTDANLAPLVTADGQEASTIPGKIAASSVVTVNGERIGVVGATTPTLRSISSPGSVGIAPSPFGSNPTDAELDALAAVIQADVDALLAANPDIDKVILLAHMQQISIEQRLATRLSNVDIIVAGGSNTRLLDDNDVLRAGDTKQGDYPFFTTDKDGKAIAVVNTDGNYKYVGRLAIEFDASGNIVPASYDATVSGAYATDTAGVAALGAEALVDPEVQTIVDRLKTVVAEQDGAIFGHTDVFLNGSRTDVRTQETNFGNLSADANLGIAKAVDPTVTISIKNGGGIRDNIGFTTFPPGSTDPADLLKLPPQANPLANKEEGDISQLDITNSLRFNNGLTLVTLTATQLLQTIEHSVAGTAPGATPGQFGQIGGLKFSFDATRPANDRVLSLAVVDDSGTVLEEVVRDGNVSGNPDRTFRIVTLNFLANGGDGYPFPEFLVANPARFNRVDLLGEDANANGSLDASEDLNQNGILDAPASEPLQFGRAAFANFGSEQDALAEYLAVNFPDPSKPYTSADTAPALDERIQNLAFREDTVLPAPPTFNIINGTRRRDILVGGADNDLITGFRGPDKLTGGGGEDRFVYQAVTDSGDRITDFEVGRDRIVFTELFVQLGISTTNPIDEGYISFRSTRNGVTVLLDIDGSQGRRPGTPFIFVDDVTAASLSDSNNFIGIA
ncbi:choice-of-anchor I family protein [Altericista sp. CCNU0014]|uniref:choice-of-anchor I family protein n=1 Tax=Altericista sp. CCNU0014 TaxID=3082949 RepID=UPI003850A515